jgi:microcystin-dependent protein
MMPIGGICMYPSAVPPTGYLLCDGALLDAETYPNLFTIIGHSFDTEAGQTTTFNVPDMRGRFVVGNGQNGTDALYTINDKGGEQAHVLTTDEVGEHTHGIVLTDTGHTHTATATASDHTHGITDPGHFHTYRNYGNYGSTGLVNGNDDPSKGSNNPDTDTKTTGITIDNASVSVSVAVASATTGISAVVGTTEVAAGHENRPPFIALAYIIRAI